VPDGTEINCIELTKPLIGMDATEAGAKARKFGLIAHRRIWPSHEPDSSAQLRGDRDAASVPDAKRSVPRRAAREVIHLAPLISLSSVRSSIPCASGSVKMGFFLPVCHSDIDLHP
jgi:hypothetical protein